jgi:hypothetical protein
MRGDLLGECNDIATDVVLIFASKTGKELIAHLELEDGEEYLYTGMV